MLQTTLDIATKVLALLLTFGLAIFVHEFGHMIFALMRGVGVESFAIGMGPKITAWYWGGIEFSLRWLPVGGFVKLQGILPEQEAPAEGPEARAYGPADQTNSIEMGQTEDGSSKVEPHEKSLVEASYDDMYALSNKGLITKLLVFGGGVFMNYVTAIVAMAVVLILPQEVPLTPFEIWSVKSGSKAEQFGFRPNDSVVEVNGRRISYLADFTDYIEERLKNEKGGLKDVPFDLMFKVERQGREVELDLPIMAGKDLLETLFGGEADDDQQKPPLEIKYPPLIGQVALTQPAEKAGLRKGDRIVSIDGQPIHYFNQLNDSIGGSLEREILVEYERDGKRFTAKMTTVAKPDDPERGMIGIVLGYENYRKVKGMPPLHAILRAPGTTFAALTDLIVRHIEFFRKATAKQVRDNLGGPVMIARVTAQATDFGLRAAIMWFITLNLLLLIFNLLPIPVLDGGFIAISIIEAVIRRPVPPRVLAPIYTVFIILLIGLMVVISVLDVKRWIM